MKYDNSLEKCNDFFTPSGDQFETVYSSKVLSDGTIELVESGKRDIRQEINSWRDHTDMAFILRAMSTGTFQPRPGAMYGDFTSAPDSMIHAMQIMIDAENAFYELPLDTRQKFDGDFKKWLALMNTDESRFMDLMGFDKPSELVVEKESDPNVP